MTSPAGGGAVADLDPGIERAADEVAVVVAVAGSGAVERWFESPGGVAEYGFEHDTPPVVERADDLMARHERERHPRLEVTRRLTLDRGQIRTADAGEETGVNSLPALTRE
ncbi:MAG: hypothetical protein R2710_26200 [Acidimicrobiales bacterium]